MTMLVYRELVRFVRQRGRISGALLTPILLWLVLGLGVGKSFQVGSSSHYLEYFYPGVLLMIVLFTGIFAMISLIEDRESGFLQSLMVSPMSSWTLVASKSLGCTLIALLQAGVFLALGPWVGMVFSIDTALSLLTVLFVVTLQVSLLSFLVAWRCHSSQSFHVWMNLLLMPMWLFSGAVFALDHAPRGMQLLMQLNPLTYGLSALRYLLHAQEASQSLAGWQMSMLISMIVTAGLFALSLFWVAKARRVRFSAS